MDRVNQIIQTIMTRRVFPIFMTVLLVLLSSISVWGLFSNESLVIERDNVVIRTGPGSNQTKKEVLKQQDLVHVLGESDGWLHVRTNDQIEGWIPQWLLDKNKIGDDQTLAIQVKEAKPLRSEASERGIEITQIPADTYLLVNYEARGWVQVNYDGQIGYIPTSAGELMDRSQLPRESYERAQEETEESSDGPSVTVSSTVTVKSYDQALYAEPSTASQEVAMIAKDTKLVYLESSSDIQGNEFYKVKDSQGQEGYISSEQVLLSDYSKDHVDQAQAKSLSEATILVDPGHGGSDPGATALDGASYEKDYTLTTAQELKAALEAAGAKVLMTRSDDSSVELADRVQQSNQGQVDVFISLHFDSSPGEGLHGITTYAYHDTDLGLANAVNNYLTNISINNNGVRFGNYQVIRENQRPSLLLELGYVSEAEDLKYIQSETYRKDVAQAIVKGLESYFDSL